MADDTTRRELSEEDLAAHQATDLPEREAMSLISTGSTVLPVYDDGGQLGLFPGSTPTDAGEASDLASSDAAAAESGAPSTTATDRSEQVTQSDSAYSAT